MNLRVPSVATMTHHRHPVFRAAGAGGLVGIALVHLLDLPGKLGETPYLGVAYIVLIVASLAAAVLLVLEGDRRQWLLAGGLAAATMVGYAINRTVGMPGAMDDIGNWTEPLGLLSLLCEGFVVILAARAVVTATRSGQR